MLTKYLILINLIAFVMFGIDKWKAKNGKYRISEAALIMSAVLGGSIGAIAGMELFRHKTLHGKFRYGLPLILTLQVLLAGAVKFLL